MACYKLVVEYDGTAYGGWQVQPNAKSIQGMLEAALERLTGSPQRVQGAGRTDAGVHARGQVARVVVPESIPPDRVALAINSRLPKDIAVRCATGVDPAFDPRRDAKMKLYRYTLHVDPIRTVLGRQYCWHISRPLDVEAMRVACRHFEGTHDFTSFTKVDSDTPPEANVRTIDRCTLLQDGCRIQVDVQGRSFLYNMVRNVVGTLVDVGTGRFPPSAVPGMLEARDRCCAGQGAPACGLCLEWIRYDGDGEGGDEKEGVDANGIIGSRNA